MYTKSNDYKLVGFCDVDYGWDRIKRNSTSGSCPFNGDNLISSVSKRKSTIALSIAQSKYILVVSCNTQLFRMKHELEYYQLSENSIPILCDNNAIIFLSKNTILNFKGKHVEIKHHFVRDYV